MDAYFRVFITETESYKVTNELLSKWNFCDVLSCSVSNLLKLSSVIDIDNILGDTKSEHPLIALTTKNMSYGAGLMIDKTLFKGFANIWNDDLFILPSSTHEVLIIPKSTHSIKECNEIIRNVNREQVDIEERLSNHVYIFNRETDSISF